MASAYLPALIGSDRWSSQAAAAGWTFEAEFTPRMNVALWVVSYRAASALVVIGVTRSMSNAAPSLRTAAMW